LQEGERVPAGAGASLSLAYIGRITRESGIRQVVVAPARQEKPNANSAFVHSRCRAVAAGRRRLSLSRHQKAHLSMA